MRLPVRPWATAVVAGSAVAVVYVCTESVVVRGVLCTVTALGGAGATVLGPRLHRPQQRLPWQLLTVAQVLFLGGIVGRPLAEAAGHAMWIAVHATSVGGYVAAVGAIRLLTRGTLRGRTDRGAMLDGAMIAIGVGTFSIIEFSLPAIRLSGRPAWLSIAESLYPLYDLVVLTVVLMLGFTAALRLPAYRSLVGCMVLILIGDLGYAWLVRSGVAVVPAAFDLPFIGAYTLLAFTTLHPSMRSLGLPPEERDCRAGGGPGCSPSDSRGWTTLRMILFVPALTLPGLLLIAEPRSRLEIAIIGVATTAALLLLLARARSALRAAHFARAHDALTGLVTRDEFMAVLGERLARPACQGGAEPGWVVLIDLEGHRHVVQFWGHQTMDTVVRQAAARLAGAAPEGALLAAVGADGFAALLTGSAEQARSDAERLRGALAAPFDVDGLELTFEVSVGVAAAVPSADPVEIMRDADTAMNAACEAGSARVYVFEPQLRACVERRAALEQALRYAAGSGELSVVYQPVVELPEGRVVGAEALLRWESSEFGSVSPPEFIQIAEETGMIEDLGAWVLVQACHRLACWNEAGLVPEDFTMAVNVSTRQLRDGGLATRVREVLDGTGLASSRIVLEVTESAMHEDQEAFIAVLTALRDVGVQISVDDFGTGYSSLSYLSRLPVTSVKLDRSLVRDVAEPPGDAIARAVQGIAQALGLTVVAEGVEDDGQRHALSRMGIAHAQGYLWGKPVPAQEFILFLTASSPQRADLPS